MTARDEAIASGCCGTPEWRGHLCQYHQGVEDGQDYRDDEIDRLRRWKAEAMVVLDQWEQVWEAAGRPGPLGAFKSESVRAELVEARRERAIGPQLGLATTVELLDEIRCRVEIDNFAGGGGLAYTTVGGRPDAALAAGEPTEAPTPTEPPDCGVDHSAGPCNMCGAVGEVGWAHVCRQCFALVPPAPNGGEA